MSEMVQAIAKVSIEYVYEIIQSIKWHYFQ